MIPCLMDYYSLYQGFHFLLDFNSGAGERCELECYSKVLSYVRVTRFWFLALGHILTIKKSHFV